VPPEPTTARLIVCALVVALFAVSVGWFVEVRSAAPPPPQVVMPGTTP
jgi:hypothetical protein